MAEAPTLKLTIAYDGTRYLGWQRQARGPTVQGVLEDALSALSADGARVAVHGAGRTDAGVHARGQVAHCRHALRVGPERLPFAVNAHCPPDVAVLAAALAAPDFHARYSATGKCYRYTLRVHPHPHPLERAWAWRVDPPLDLAAMRAAAAALTGRHDFSSFTTHAHEAPADRVRELRRVAIDDAGARCTLTFEGSGFLRNMVRAIVGTLVQVGRGRRDPAGMAAVLAARDRRRAGPTAPAHGLCLESVGYDPSARRDAPGRPC